LLVPTGSWWRYYVWLLTLLWRSLCINDWLNLKHRSWCFWLSLAERKTGVSKQHSDCNFICPLLIHRGSQTRCKRGSEWRRRQKVFFILGYYGSLKCDLFLSRWFSVVTTKLCKGSPNDATRGSTLELTIASSWAVCRPFMSYFPFPSLVILFSDTIILSFCFYFHSFLFLTL